MMATRGNYWFTILCDLEIVSILGTDPQMPTVSGDCAPTLPSVASVSQQLFSWLGLQHLQIPTSLGTGTRKILPRPCCLRHWSLPHPPNPACLSPSYRGTPYVPFSFPNSSYSSPIHLFPLPSLPGQRFSNNFLLLPHLPLSPLLYCPSLSFHDTINRLSLY